ncbi:uncharacterized protein GIQ15_01625 [Arthroderma uncinatum]|uniref:uncharacterized protein n=1 Tax=Arthroderma uncinatum TaxID=74035 RepID=UPI00144A9293|nr:uncharacterized protein GIQ15_01625 [Arthroderma uncinatum]KAF3492108.1 hypothetical protein GIQ15_01625 [Arthroderma uncinatum]
MAEEPVAVEKPPKISYKQPQSSSESFSIQEDYLRRHSRWSNALFGGHIRFPDVDEDIGHTIVCFLYTGKYETLRVGSIQDGPNIVREMRRSVQAYHAARIYGLTGLEMLAKMYIEKFSKSVSVFDLLQAVKSMFSKLPEGEAWLPSYIDARLAREYERDENIFKGEEFYDLLGEHRDFDKAILRMVINTYSSHLSSLQFNIEQENEAEAEYAVAEEPLLVEEAVVEEPLLAEEPRVEEPPVEEVVAEKSILVEEEKPAEECPPHEEFAPVEEEPVPDDNFGWGHISRN